MATNQSATDSTAESVNPHRCDYDCSNCGGSMTPTRQVGAYANVPMSCDECESTGTVVKNRLGMITGTYGAVTIVTGE